MRSVSTFLERYKLRAADFDTDSVVKSFLSEMEKGLEGAESSLRMIPTYIEADNKFKTGVPVTAIDAGGTNFRVAKVMFTDDGKLKMSEPLKEKMPGQNGRVSKEEFFTIVADYVKDIAEQTESIGFCFSYPTEILPNKDGILLQFSKEVQAPEVVGELIGENLLNALGMPDKEIVLLNDTVATLLAGKSASFEKEYDSYIGFILGTGTNTCYIEKNKNITKSKNLEPGRSQIINMETGAFGKAPRGALDAAFDDTTATKGEYHFEKMFSGGYFGGLVLTVLKAAADEGLLSSASGEKLQGLKDLPTENVNRFLDTELADTGPLAEIITGDEDREISREIIRSLLARAAKLVAANLAAVIIKTGKGLNAGKPILITVEGTSYYKLEGLKSQVEAELSDYLSGENKRYYEFAYVDQSSLVGGALAALIE